jgi:D-alanyl-D-alanine dipeptidase
VELKGVGQEWRLLAVPPAELDSMAREGVPLPEEVAMPSGRARSVVRNDPLVEVTGLATLDAYEALGIFSARRAYLRAPLLARLVEAERHLPKGLGFVVLDGWRSLDEQQALVDHYSTQGVSADYVSRVEPGGVRPPHTTGGAVDLTLSWQGVALGLGTDFDNFTEAAHLRAFEKSPGLVRYLRRVLASSLLSQDLAPFNTEWWHWSYGDDVWASFRGGPSLFDVVDRGNG